jgi:hypothetical protein
MGTIVAAEYLTLDGVAEDPGSTGEFEHRGWSVEAVRKLKEEQDRDLLIYGSGES